MGARPADLRALTAGHRLAKWQELPRALTPDALCRQTAHPDAALAAHRRAAAATHRRVRNQQCYTQVLQPSRRARDKKARKMAARLLATTARRLAMPAAAAFTATAAAACDSQKEDRLEALERRVAALEPRKTNPTDHWASDLLAADVLFSERDIEQMVGSLATQISRDYAGRDVVIVGLMDGVFMFLADLSRKIDTQHQLDFISASSYGLGTVSSGNVRIKKDADTALAGKHVLLVDEICDSGRTLASLKLLISQRNAASVKTCVLLDKVSRRQADIRPDYVGAVCPDEFVVGYGMDWGGKLRSLPFVGVVRRELYES